MTISLALLGSSGKMGQRILASAAKDPVWRVVACPARDKDQLTEALERCDVAIDFSSPEATQEHLAAVLAAKKPFVLGTTGHTPQQKEAIDAASKEIPILYSPNFSFGIALCLDAASRMASALPPSYTVKILETHHVHKKDSPSGTALALAKATGRDAPIHAQRTGEVIGEHTIVFESEEERIELKHTAHSRDAFAQGALLAAKFLLQKPPGLYTLQDLFSNSDTL